MIDDHSSAVPAEESLFGDVTTLIAQARGRAVVTRLAERLIARDGHGYSRSALFRMGQFAATYEKRSIVATLSRQLSGSHFVQVIALDDADERRFYEAGKTCTLARPYPVGYTGHTDA